MFVKNLLCSMFYKEVVVEHMKIRRNKIHFYEKVLCSMFYNDVTINKQGEEKHVYEKLIVFNVL